jgi:hypothetical protein
MSATDHKKLTQFLSKFDAFWLRQLKEQAVSVWTRLPVRLLAVGIAFDADF